MNRYRVTIERLQTSEYTVNAASVTEAVNEARAKCEGERAKEQKWTDAGLEACRVELIR